MAGWLFGKGRGQPAARKVLRMQMIVLAAVVLIVYVGVNFRKGRSVELTEYASVEGGYSIVFPADPVQLCQVVETPAGEVRFFMIQRRTPRYFCMAGYGDYPGTAVENAAVAKRLDAVRDGIVSNCQGSLITERSLTIDNYPARQIAVQTEQDSTVYALLVIARTRLYQVMVVTSSGDVENKRVAEVFQSLRIGPPGESI